MIVMIGSVSQLSRRKDVVECEESDQRVIGREEMIRLSDRGRGGTRQGLEQSFGAVPGTVLAEGGGRGLVLGGKDPK